MNPGFCMVVLRFTEAPDSETEAERVIGSVVDTVNESASRTGVYAMCLAVSGWDGSEVLATFMVIEKSGDDTKVTHTFRHALSKNHLEQKLSILDRKDRLGNVRSE